ncbi:hypothetical protein Poli38472_006864 [Pythium oligandrum]|uniref:Uncharacterized protein n=1 Tax=Pythium oligandrum TaxID=41045 RepID=A0A8K1C5J3_PYTOL|nr:hypothetical protein Poli38472_006864 [Pythium oligandrum]|eukprot:TMW56854.1 hypothetical protein Poli38472_006864 [Pythium oligandrum]
MLKGMRASEVLMFPLDEPVEVKEIEIEVDDEDNSLEIAFGYTVKDFQGFGRDLQSALSSLPKVAETFSQRLHDELDRMAGEGTLLGEAAVLEPAEQWQHIASFLLRDQALKITRALKQIASKDPKWLPLMLKAKECTHQVARTFEDQQAAVVALSERLQQTRHSIDEEIRAIARGLKPPALAGFKYKIKRFLPPLLRLEIVRDFMQTLSLFFTHLYFTARDRADIDGFSEVMEKIQDGLRYVYNFAAADFPALYANFDVKKLMQNKTLIDAAFVFLLLFVGISYLLYLWFCFIVWCNWTTERQIRELDATTKQRRPFIKRVTLVLTICLSIYLPTMRLSIEILGGSSDTSVVRRRYENIDHWLWLQIAAIIFLATFTLPLPLLLALLVRKHKPKTLPHKPESTYNLDGDVIPMDINVYAHKIAHDPDQLQCPYRSLYEGLEREWCYYKIFQLVSKAVLVLLVLFIPGEQLRNALTLAVCVTVSFFTFRWKPFIDPLNDQMEICGKATALLTCIKGVLVSTKRIDKKWVSAFGFLVNAASILNSIFMAAGCVYGIEFVRALIKDTFGRLKFSDTGPDVYFPPLDEQLRLPVSYFGRLSLIPYPFHCVLDYDDGDRLPQQTIIDDDEFARRFSCNFTPSVLEKRLLRQKLRAISLWGDEIELPFTQEEEYGLLTIASDAKEAVPTMNTVRFVCHYQRGTIVVRDSSPASDTTSEKKAITGFHVSMVYRDGYGEIQCPQTGQILTCVVNRVAEVGPQHLGLTAEMLESPTLRAIFSQTTEPLAQFLPQVQKKEREIRVQHVAKHGDINRVLSSGFRHVVYNNPQISRPALEKYLAQEETNPKLHRVPVTHRVALDDLYARVKCIQRNDATKFWYVFWDDVFDQNGSMKALKPHHGRLNPGNPAFIGYTVLPKEELIEWLKSANLWGENRHWKRLSCLFNTELVNLVYERMSSLEDPKKPSNVKRQISLKRVFSMSSLKTNAQRPKNK